MSLTKLGRFEIIREIGKGAMGQVFLASDPKIQRQVAIKTIVLPPGTSAEEAHETSQRFLREAQAAGRLLHPNIVTIFDVGEEAGVSFIAMEFIEGETLERYARPGNLLPPGRVLDLMGQAASALDHAHLNHIVHRDIKPANLMVLKGGVLKVTDFGLAKNPSANLTQVGVLLGTPSYMSPEQIQGRDLDGRSDVFSLGVVLYELLTGVRPFEGESISTIIYRVLYEDPRPPAAHNPALPPEVNGILEKALAKEPDDRYASGEEMVADLRSAFAGLPPETLSRPFPGAAAGARPGGRDAGVPGTLRRPAGGRRAGRRERAGGELAARGAMAAPDRPTMFAHHPGKITALLLVAVAGLIVFPRWANRQEPGAEAGDEASRVSEEDLSLTPASVGGPPGPVGPAGSGHGGGGRSPGVTGGQVAVEVETMPPGGVISLDSIPLAQPKVILSLSDPKPHDIVARAGCRHAVAEMTAADLASFKGSLTLELKPRKEEVTIGSEPAGARIKLNGADTGKVTPAVVTIAGCEDRAITLLKEGFRPWTRDYDSDDDFDAMAEGLRKVPLEPIPAGTLLVRKPQGYDLEIYEGEKHLGKAGEAIALPEGRRSLTFRNDAVFVSEKALVTIEGGKVANPVITFPALGSLTVQAQPSNCKVYVDGTYVDVTPVLNLPISAGGHRVKVVFVPNGATQEVAVAVDSGKNALVTVKF
jgi:hypothetical protein